MSLLSEYRRKLKTPDDAVKVVRSGDWVDYGMNSNLPELLDEALAKRKDELQDVKVRGGEMCIRDSRQTNSAMTVMKRPCS